MVETGTHRPTVAGVDWRTVVTAFVVGYPPDCAEDPDGNLLVTMTSDEDFVIRKYSPTGGLDQCADVAAEGIANAKMHLVR